MSWLKNPVSPVRAAAVAYVQCAKGRFNPSASSLENAIYYRAVISRIDPIATVLVPLVVFKCRIENTGPAPAAVVKKPSTVIQPVSEAVVKNALVASVAVLLAFTPKVCITCKFDATVVGPVKLAKILVGATVIFTPY